MDDDELPVRERVRRECRSHISMAEWNLAHANDSDKHGLSMIMAADAQVRLARLKMDYFWELYPEALPS